MNKTVYVLKQEPLVWFKHLARFLTRSGFNNSKTGPSLLTMASHGFYLYVLVYVDNLIATEDDDSRIDRFVEVLCKNSIAGTWAL